MLTRISYLVTLTLLAFPGPGNALKLRKALGRYNVGVKTLTLTDTSRLDPMAPTPQNRSVQLSIHYPTQDTQSPGSIYLPDITAAATELQLAAFQVPFPSGSLHDITTYNHVNATILQGGKGFPFVLFSPGLTLSRLLFTTFAQDLASEGYIVVSIDHPYDAVVVEMSDGRVIRAIDPFNTTESVLRTFNTRVDDARFVLDELSRASPSESHIPGLRTGPITRAGFFGHSLGGATAATTEVVDSRIYGAVNMDGFFQGEEVKKGSDKPLGLFLASWHNVTTDPSMPLVLPNFIGFRRIIHVNETTHFTFTDGPVLAEQLGLDLDVGLGEISAKRFDQIQHEYLTAFFDYALKGKQSKLLNEIGTSKPFPEVVLEH